jgi:predicted metal-binding membrane protein
MPRRAVRNHLVVVAALFAAAALAWWWTVGRMAGMDGAPGADLGTLGWFTGSWAVMMAAMMLPSSAPTLTAYATLAREPSLSRPVLFACGYLLTWTVAGLAAYALFELGKGVVGDVLAWRAGGRWVSAGVLAAAAAYQLAPPKTACLRRCRGQLGELRGGPSQSWRAALAMGARSGCWCIGCSWALMAALFALGVMSLTWMVVIAAMVLIERIWPWPLAARLATAIVLAALAGGVIVAPHDVPGFVVPGSGAAHAMSMMG